MRRPAIIALAVVSVAALLVLAWRGFAPRAEDADVLSGYVEGDSLYLAAPVAAEVSSLSVRDGDHVAPGATLFTIDPKPLRARRDAAAAELGQARAEAQTARAGLGQQKANLLAANAQAANAAREARRAQALAAGGVASTQDLERAQTAARDTDAARQAAGQLVAAANAQAAASEAAVARAGAALAEAQSRLEQLSLRAPAAGRIERTYLQPGEWAAANQPVLSLIPDDRLKLRFFVPEREVSLYRVGRRVQFGCDACRAGRGATIAYVSPRPEYTPPVIYSRKARDRLVFLVEARPDQPEDLNPGQPVDVTPLASPAGRRP